jgi:hypothetical protein
MRSVSGMCRRRYNTNACDADLAGRGNMWVDILDGDKRVQRGQLFCREHADLFTREPDVQEWKPRSASGDPPARCVCQCTGYHASRLARAQDVHS